LKDQRGCGKGGIEVNVREVGVGDNMDVVREVGVGDNMDVAATGSRPVTIYPSRLLVGWRNIPRIVRYSQ
jgi:hypothetical protein